MKECTSKYHKGDRLTHDELFSGSNPHRCRLCARATSAAYQRSERGRAVKQQHYVQNHEAYKATQRKSLDRSIAADRGVSYLYTSAKRRAKRYGISFEIEPHGVVVTTLCPVYNIPLAFSATRTDNTPSLDRIDNTRGYVPGNVRVISWKANHKKRDLTIDDIHILYKYMTET